MESIFTIIGAVGSILCILMYFCLERGYAKGTDIWYYALNGLGGFMILVGALYDFDGGDMGLIIQEVCWVMISVAGIVKLVQSRQAMKKDQF